jgi:hypothetical protein
MTEGIIQKTFNQFRAERLGRSITYSETLTLENRLVEEIKKYHFDDDAYFNDTIKQQLIGDTR